MVRATKSLFNLTAADLMSETLVMVPEEMSLKAQPTCWLKLQLLVLRSSTVRDVASECCRPQTFSTGWIASITALPLAQRRRPFGQRGKRRMPTSCQTKPSAIT